MSSRPRTGAPYPRTVCLALLLATLLLVPNAAAAGETGAELEVQTASDPPTLFGLSGGDWRTYVPELARATGRSPAFQGLFWTFDDYAWPNAWAPAALDDVIASGAVPFVEITTADFDSFVAGGSVSLEALVDTVATWAKESADNRLLVAPFPEANLPAHPWGADRFDFIDAFEDVVGAFTDAGLGPDKIRFVFALNGGIAGSLTWDDFYPGDDLVDIVAFSKLNRNDPWRDYEASFGQHISDIQQELTLSKPILAFQTGSVVENRDRAGWLEDMFSNLLSEDQVLGAIYFNVEKFEAGKPNDYRIIVGNAVDPTVSELYPTWSHPSETSWIFDGRMDAWEQERRQEVEDGGGFLDTTESVFAADIAWLAATGITRGCNPPDNDLFCPSDPVTRGQMAAFLVRALGYADVGPGFTDTSGSIFEGDIARLAQAGVTKGCNPPDNDRFCPNDNVTRGQMAAFLVRAMGYTEPGTEFEDTAGSVFQADIARLAQAGVTKGCNPPVNDLFCPTDVVTRGQMAAFLHRALGDS